MPAWTPVTILQFHVPDAYKQLMLVIANVLIFGLNDPDEHVHPMLTSAGPLP